MVDHSSNTFEQYYLDNYTNTEKNNFINIMP